TGTKWSLQSSDKASINPFGDTINFAKAENVAPLLLDAERFIYIPLAADKDLLEIENSGSETFHLNGKSKIIDTGWYFPIIDINNSLGLSCLGMLNFSGYIGFRGTERIALDWPGLENGKLTIDNFLILTRPGRSLLKYSYTALSRTTQNLRTWKSAANNQVRSIITLNPGGTGDGYCLQDNQQMEALFQPATISAKTDRPINANQQSFDIAGNVGAVVFIKIEDKTNIALLGTYPKPIANAEKKRRIPQSLCLRNALLVTDNPFSIFVGGILTKEQIIAEGSFYLGFPVFRMINTLPDPYITNQQYLQDQELFNFNNLWRSGEDTLPDKFDLSITACVRWNDENTTLGFSLNNSHINNRRDDRELLDRFRDSGNLCRSLENESALRNEDIQRINSFDPENVTGAFGYLQWLPGNLSLVDISESVNRWGVSFSDTVSEDKLILAENLGFPSGFPVRIKNMDLVSSGRMTRLFTLPHIQWEPVLKIKSPAGDEPGIPSIINFTGNGNPTRISTSNKDEVELIPRNLYNFIIDGFNSEGKPFAMAANFSLPFGICANAYFNPKILDKLPSAKALFNEPEFSDKKTGKLKGGMQLHVEAIAPPNAEAGKTDNHLAYFIGSAIQLPANGIQVNILGDIIGKQFNKEFSSGANAKVPLERIDFSGYGASIFSNWLNESANFGAVSQVKFDVLIGRTAHEV
ncbi:MAG: hypothetical protein ABI091_17720, partial [Ferruginibacter sp.]